MASFGTDGRCLMRTLQEQLDDGDAQDCGRCSVCAGARFGGELEPGLVATAERFLRSVPIELEVRKMAPDASGAMRKIPDDVRIEPGWALARVGDGGWWPAVEAVLRGAGGGGESEGEGESESDEFGDEVVRGLAALIGPAGQRAGWVPSWVTSIPSARLGDRLSDLGRRLADALGVPYVELIERRESRPPQREMANAVAQTANVRGAFRVVAEVPGGTGVLLDDTRGSGWTLAMVGGQLRRAGAARVVPLVLGTVN